jgi:hypothetical protein
MNGAATVPVLNGRGIAHRKLDRHQRAELAAEVVTGARPFVPSYEQACTMFGVPRYVLTQHLKARRTFAAQHPEIAGGNGNAEHRGNRNGNSASVVVAMLRECTPVERIEVARSLGLDWVWDHLIAPGIQTEREAIL